MKKYVVRNKLTNAVCGKFNTANEAGKWVEEYTQEQNEGLDPNSEEYCSPFHFQLEEEVQDLNTYTGACEYLGLSEDNVLVINRKHIKALVALSKLFTIAEAWNKEDGFVPDFSNKEQRKYFPWFEYNRVAAGFVCGCTTWVNTVASATIGSRLCFATRERALAFGNLFEGLYNDFLLM